MSRRHVVDIDSGSDTDDMEDVRYTPVSSARPGPTVPAHRPIVVDEDEELARAIQASIDEQHEQQQQQQQQHPKSTTPPPRPVVVEDDYERDFQEAIKRSLAESGGVRAPSPPPRYAPPVPAVPSSRRTIPIVDLSPPPSQPSLPQHRPPLYRSRDVDVDAEVDGGFDQDPMAAEYDDPDLQEAIRRSMATGDEEYYPTLQREDSGMRLRRAQDTEYEESLRRDRQKQLEREQEEQLAQMMAAEEQRQAAEQARVQRLAEETRARKLAALPAEPSGDGPEVTSIMVRFPEGQRFSRKFRMSDAVQDLQNFVETREGVSLPSKYTLVCPFPRTVVAAQDAARSLRELNLHNCALNVVSDE